MAGDELLKKPPENLKDAIDWILWFHGYGRTIPVITNYTKLAKTLRDYQEFTDAKKQAFDDKEPEGIIKKLAEEKLGRGFLGYVSQGGGFNFDDSGIIKNGNGYTSAYLTESGNITENDEALAQIFLGTAAITFFGLSFLAWKCRQTHGGWNRESLIGSGINSGLGKFMKNMGYDPTYLNGNKRGKDVAQLLEDGETGFDGLVKPETQIIYDNFVRKLETQYNPQTNALNSPLTACYKFARVYFTSKFKRGEPVDATLTSIKAALETFKSSCRSSASDLFDQIGSFIFESMTAPSSPKTENKANEPSPAGPVAGTLTTLGLGGGAAAAYVFNLGGTKTLVNGLLKIS
ncbi:variant erythrocyte surface antigen-1, beta subunit [Babesia caballi]|uniref:Variant erythrocyte surface antigen-1, beta subunit n=1 Tax=Babesia caballi TaxID=5871 RepID=A0AAV4LZG2_BABCB|nr:variant erythrocyte surface antigen-1, beta subunit [Babesia caballi]